MESKEGAISMPLAGALLAVIFLAAQISVWDRTPSPAPDFSAAALGQSAAAAAAVPTGGPAYCLSGNVSAQQYLSQKCMPGCEYQVIQGNTASGEKLSVLHYPPPNLTPAQQAALPPGEVTYYTFNGQQKSVCGAGAKTSIYQSITSTPAPYQATQMPPPEVKATYTGSQEFLNPSGTNGASTQYDPLHPPAVTTQPLGTSPSGQYDPLHPPVVSTQALPDANGRYPLSAVPQNGTGWDVSNCYTSGANVGACAIKLNPNVGEIAPTPSAPTSPYSLQKMTTPSLVGSPANPGVFESPQAGSSFPTPAPYTEDQQATFRLYKPSYDIETGQVNFGQVAPNEVAPPGQSTGLSSNVPAPQPQIGDDLDAVFKDQMQRNGSVGAVTGPPPGFLDGGPCLEQNGCMIATGPGATPPAPTAELPPPTGVAPTSPSPTAPQARDITPVAPPTTPAPVTAPPTPPINLGPNYSGTRPTWGASFDPGEFPDVFNRKSLIGA